MRLPGSLFVSGNTELQWPVRFLGEVSGRGRECESDSRASKTAYDFQVDLFAELHGLPAPGRVVPVGNKDIERVGVEFIEEDARRKFRART